MMMMMMLLLSSITITITITTTFLSTMMTMNSATKKLLLLALACCFYAKNSCIGLCPAVLPSSTSITALLDRRCCYAASAAGGGAGWSCIPPSTSSTQTTRRSQRRRRITRSALFGYANVNDYFASFNNNTTVGNNNSGASNTHSSPTNNNNNSNTTAGKYNYIGHGRIVNDGTTQSETERGGLFDVNNYFTSLNNNSNNSGGEQSTTKATTSTKTTTSRDGYTDNHKINPVPKRKPPTPTTTGKKMLTYQEIIASNNARLCPKLLLTQRAIQSFIYLLEECRDPHSGKWIEDFLGLQNLGNYHGNGAINTTKYPTWDSVLHDMMNQPNTHVIVSAKRRGRGHGGWSKNNPFLEERYVEFKIDIRPASLVQRLLSVRGQLASEFERDLDIITMVDDRIMDSYFDKLRTVSTVSENQRRGQISSSSAGTGTAASFSPNSPKSTAFDRISIDILTNFTEAQETSSSPFRRGNFDLLYSLSTHASAHRLLRELQQSGSSSSSISSITKSSSSSSSDDITFQWFKKFYTERVSEYFDGDQPFGRGDDFIDALLTTSPSLVEMSDGITIGLTDPLRIAERIIEIRSMVAQEWKSMMREEVKNDHLEMNDVLFRIMMGRTMEDSRVGDGIVGEIQEESTQDELANTTGTFE